MAAIEARPAFTSRLTPINLVAIGLLVALAAWLVWNFVDAPAQFVQVATIGVTNGMIIALIALGYTMVYGIIELINFAHGDLFMLGSFLALHAGRPARLAAVEQRPRQPRGSCWRAGRRRRSSAPRSTGPSTGWPTSRCATAPKLAPLVSAIGVSFILHEHRPVLGRRRCGSSASRRRSTPARSGHQPPRRSAGVRFTVRGPDDRRRHGPAA